MTSPVYQLSDDYIERLAALDPGSATYMGIKGFDDKMTDFSPAGHAARAELDSSTLTSLNKLEATDSADRLAAGVAAQQVGLDRCRARRVERLGPLQVPVCRPLVGVRCA